MAILEELYKDLKSNRNLWLLVLGIALGFGAFAVYYIATASGRERNALLTEFSLLELNIRTDVVSGKRWLDDLLGYNSEPPEDSPILLSPCLEDRRMVSKAALNLENAIEGLEKLRDTIRINHYGDPLVQIVYKPIEIPR